jgi:uncharacterized protein
MSGLRKIINDPVYGFITIDHPLILDIVAHPWYQRLRRINQMAFAHLVYPGAMHSRLHHSLGAYHLMCNALAELKSKGTPITDEEELAAKIAILLHDIGHGPYSHALENILIKNVNHESISVLIMQKLNAEFGGRLELALDIFRNQYRKRFLHQLVSGQLDVDRMDYLSRDSFFTGVAEGVISYDRILKMLVVHKDQLMIEEKGIYSIEKFLVARRLMYWQVYLHKTVVSAEMMLVRIIERARDLIQKGIGVETATQALDFFLYNNDAQLARAEDLDIFCRLDDVDVMCTVKNWVSHPDKILSILCRSLVDRKLFKVSLQSEPFDKSLIEEKKKEIQAQTGIRDDEVFYFVFTGEAINTTYNLLDERINIFFKDGSIKDISQVDNALIHQQLSGTIKKFYICYLRSL